MRLNKYLAECGVCSRRKADEIIAEGRVSVNRKTVSEMGFDVDEKKDVVYLDGKKIVPVTHYEYIMFNKPKGCVTTMSDEKGRKTVYDFIGREKRLVPVGRLDYDSEGLLLFTNDGELTYKLTHPSGEVRRRTDLQTDAPVRRSFQDLHRKNRRLHFRKRPCHTAQRRDGGRREVLEVQGQTYGRRGRVQPPRSCHYRR